MQDSDSLFQRFRQRVHTVKPLTDAYIRDPDHRPDKKTKTTRNNRTVQSVNGQLVQSQFSNVSPLIQGILYFISEYMLQLISGGGGGGDGDCGGGGDCGDGGDKHQHPHPMIAFLTDLLKHSAYGRLHTAKSHRFYADVMGISKEHCSGWFNVYNSQYIICSKDATYTTVQALLGLLREPSKITALSDSEMDLIVDGFVCMCALPDSAFRECFDRPRESTTQNAESLYYKLCFALQEAVEKSWSGKSHEEMVTFYNSGTHGTGRSWFYNIQETYFSR